MDRHLIATRYPNDCAIWHFAHSTFYSDDVCARRVIWLRKIVDKIVKLFPPWADMAKHKPENTLLY